MIRTFEHGVTVLDTEGAGSAQQSKAGYPGVYEQSRGGGYMARWSSTHLGTFRTFEEAVAIRKEAEEHAQAGTFDTWSKGLKKRKRKKRQ